MAKKDKFPSVMYAKISTEGKEEYFDAGRDFSALVDMGETARIAIYNLSDIVEVEGTAVIVS